MVAQRLIFRENRAFNKSAVKDTEYSGASVISLNEHGLSPKFRIPKHLAKEISALYGLGLQDDEVNYILHLKAKEEAGSKWN